MSPPTPPPVQLPAADRCAQPWINGQGVSTPVTSGGSAGSGKGPLWWIAIARISGDCDFSKMVGIDRLFMPLEDVALSLDLDGRRTVAPRQVIEFAGEMAPRCSAAGPTSALNLMLRRGQAAGMLSALELDGPVELEVRAGATLVVISLFGAPRVGGELLAPGDAVRQDASAGPATLRLDGRGRAAVIWVKPEPPLMS